MSVYPGVDVYLEVNSVPLDTYAWRCLSYGDLFSAPTVRGGDLVMPGVPGQRPYPRMVDATTKSLSMHVYGWRDADGVAIADPLEGLLTHAEYLYENLGLGSQTGDGTVPAVFHRGSLDQLEGDVTVLAISDWQNWKGREATFRLDLSIPAGLLVAVP